ncbi:hypothetical protein Tco_0941537 [Tanacetum coccineum]|uniref:Uncharacterized protein n=1 Tax=Tanacetum coccineum TaxID=301880 RepID=A0ABQ5DTI2_9ASTR
MSTRIAEAAALSPSSFCKRYRSSYKTSSLSSSSTLPVQKRYKGTFELILDTDSEGDELGEEDTEEDESSDTDDEREREGLDDEGQGLDEEGQGLDDEGLDDEGQGLEDEGPGMEEEEVAPEGQQQAVPVVDIAVSEPLGLGYGAARCHALESTEEIAPSTYEVGQSSRSMPEQEGAERVSTYRQPTLVTWVDPEDGRVYTDIPTYVPLAAPVQTPPSSEWSLGSLLVLPSSPIVSLPIDSSVATPAATISVDEDQFLEVGAQLELHVSILHDHTQHLDALPRTLFEGYDKDLKELYTRSGAGHTDTQRAALWHAIYDIQRGNHDLRRQLAEERRERLELTYHVARIERRQESRGE